MPLTFQMGACITMFHRAADAVLGCNWDSGEKGQGERLEKEHTEGPLSEESSHLHKISLVYRKNQLLNK